MMKKRPGQSSVSPSLTSPASPLSPGDVTPKPPNENSGGGSILDRILPVIAVLLCIAVFLQAVWSIEVRFRDAETSVRRAKSELVKLANNVDLPDPFAAQEAEEVAKAAVAAAAKKKARVVGSPSSRKPAEATKRQAQQSSTTTTEATIASTRAAAATKPVVNETKKELEQERKLEVEDEHDHSDQENPNLFELTPVPPVLRNRTRRGSGATIPPQDRDWPDTDPNYGFKPNYDLPLVGIITLNAQAGGKDRIRTTHNKASWIHSMSYHNKVEYAKKWGYDLIIEDNDIVDKTRDVAWSKIPIWKKWLPKYQWLMWMDMDAFFMRYDIDIATFLDENKDIVIAKDWNGINMGVMFVRNSPFTFKLLDDMWHCSKAWWFPWEEQSALMNMLNPKQNGKKARELEEHFKYPRQREMNSYPAEFSYGNKLAKYQDGDFIAHFPNCKGFRTCQTTIKRHYEKSLKENDVPKLTQEVPASLFPDDPLSP